LQKKIFKPTKLIVTRAIATNKMPLQILGEVVHEKITASI